MDISTASWFNYLHEEIINEGLRDIGLSEPVVDFIEEAMFNSPEKAKTYAGNEWKKYELPATAEYMLKEIGEVLWKEPSKTRFRKLLQRIDPPAP